MDSLPLARPGTGGSLVRLNKRRSVPSLLEYFADDVFMIQQLPDAGT